MFSFNDYTNQQLKAARGYAAQPILRKAGRCLDPDYFAPHITPQRALEIQQDAILSAQAVIAGERDHSLTIRQRMEYYLTGESTPLLPKS